MKQSVQLGILSAMNIFIAFLFQWYVLTQLGPGEETDALFAGMTIPQLVLAVISGSLAHVLVPLLAGEDESKLRQDAWSFLLIIGGLFSLLAIILYVTASWWIPFSVPGFSDTGKLLTIELTRIQLIGMVFSAINSVLWANYQARHRFLWAEFIPILSSTFSVLLLIWALPHFGVISAAWISAFRIMLQTLLLLPGMGRPIWLDLKTDTLQKAWALIKPLMSGALYYKTDVLVDRFLLSTVSGGTLSLYYIAQQLYGAVSQVISKAITTPIVPILTKFHKSGDRDSFRRIYYLKIFQVGIVGLFWILVLGLMGENLLALLVGHGSVSNENVNDLWLIMFWLGGMFIGGILGEISSLSFYVSGDTITPTRIGIQTYTFYIPVKILLFYYFGVFGLAFATSSFVLVNFIFQNIQLKKHYL